MPRRTMRRIRLCLLVPLLLSLTLPTIAFGAPAFTTNGFKVKWERADKPVDDGSANPSRSWLWGPEGFSAPAGNTEPYAESPGGVRQVQYFDKARMELNDPSKGYVSNGLLVRELISGKLATGDAATVQRQPANDIPVAGDPDGNQGPVYFSFATVTSLNNDNTAQPRVGSPVSDTLGRDGKVGTSADLGNLAKYAYFENNLKHNIPDVFWTFMNQRGTIYENSKLSENQPILGDNPAAPWLDATGFPLSEAYWGKVTLAGQVKDVLIQVFERRVLTYTPSNPLAFQVEMGNVGRHYYAWRYSNKYDAPAVTPTPTQPPASGCNSLPASKGGAYPFLKCGPAGMEMAVVVPMQANEQVQITITSPAAAVVRGTRKAQGDGNLLQYYPSKPTEQGRWTFNFKGLTSGKEAETYVFLEAPVSKPTIIVFPNPGKLDQDITIVAVGFQPDEELVFGAKAPPPDSPVLGLVTEATSGGGATVRLIPREIFKGDDAKYLVPGDWVALVTSKDKVRIAAATIRLEK